MVGAYDRHMARSLDWSHRRFVERHRTADPVRVRTGKGVAMSTETIERTVEQATDRRLIGRRNILAGIGGLGLAGAIGINRVLAQEATPTATDDEDGGETDVEPADVDIEREIGEAYDTFVA